MRIPAAIFDSEPWRSEIAAIEAFLTDSNAKGASADEIAAHARSIAMASAYAKQRRTNKRIRQARNGRQIEVSQIAGKRTIKADLQRMRAPVIAGDIRAFGLAFVEASPDAQNRIGGPLTPARLMDRQGILNAINAALAAPDLAGRPRDLELDRLTGILLDAYEATVAKATATRDKDRSGAGFSDAHAFLADASKLLGLPVTGSGDDARLRRVLRARSAAKS